MLGKEMLVSQFGYNVWANERILSQAAKVDDELLKPYFKLENIGCISWGLVSGKSQTIYPWGSKEGSPEPEIWFHDIFRSDGTPFDTNETKLIKEITQK